MRIDAHVHYTPPELAGRLEAFTALEPYWGLLVRGQQPTPSLQAWASAETMVEDMDRAGIDKVVIQGEYRQRHETSVERNTQAIELVRRYPDRLLALAVLQPKVGSQALVELQRCVDGGLRGVGELNPYAQGFRLDEPDFLRLVEACLAYDLPLNLHANEEVGAYYPGKSTTPLRHYYGLAQRYPDLKLILAHWGGGLFFYELMPQVRRDLSNVWYDTAASPLLYPTSKIFPVALACLDYRKILYGSDYPLRIVPRQQSGPDFRPFLAQIEALGLEQQVYDAIMGGNAARLFNLSSTTGQAESKNELSASPPSQTHPVGQARYSIEPVKITPAMPVTLVAGQWPETQAIFEKRRIPWRDSPVPAWEPIAQAAAAQGWGPREQQRLLDELNQAIT